MILPVRCSIVVSREGRATGSRLTRVSRSRVSCIQAVGIIGKKTIPLDDAWFVEYSYGTYRYNNETNEGGYVNQGWYLMNKLQGIKQSITQEQAQTSDQRSQGYSWTHIDDDQAKQLAVELGLAS